MTVREFLQLYRENRIRALEQAHAAANRICIGFLINRGCKEAQAADLFVDALMILDRHSSAGTLQAGPRETRLTSYLCGILYKLWRGGSSDREGLTQLPFDPTDPVVSGVAIEQDEPPDENMLDLMRRSFRGLSRQCQEVLGLFYYNDCSMQEIAETCDYANTDAAKTAKYRCLERLRTSFFSTQNQIEP